MERSGKRREKNKTDTKSPAEICRAFSIIAVYRDFSALISSFKLKTLFALELPLYSVYNRNTVKK